MCAMCSVIGNLSCLRHLFRLTVAANLKFKKNTHFVHTCATLSKLTSNESTMTVFFKIDLQY